MDVTKWKIPFCVVKTRSMYVLQCFFSSPCFVIVKNAFFWTERMLNWPHDKDNQLEFYISVSGLWDVKIPHPPGEKSVQSIEVNDDLGGSCRKSCQHLYSCLQPKALQAVVPEHPQHSSPSFSFSFKSHPQLPRILALSGLKFSPHPKKTYPCFIFSMPKDVLPSYVQRFLSSTTYK